MLLTLAAGIVGFAAFVPGIDRESMLRTIFAVFFATATWMSNPTTYLAELAELAGLNSDDRDQRVKSVKSLAERGTVDYEGVDLTGADLRHQGFSFATLDRASLQNADLSGAQFLNTSLRGTLFHGTKLEGAIFMQSSVDRALGFERATCDEASRLPAGWSCIDGHPNR